MAIGDFFQFSFFFLSNSGVNTTYLQKILEEIFFFFPDQERLGTSQHCISRIAILGYPFNLAGFFKGR